MITRKTNSREKYQSSLNARVNQILEFKRWKIDEKLSDFKDWLHSFFPVTTSSKLLRKMDRPLLGLDYKSFKYLICWQLPVSDQCRWSWAENAQRKSWRCSNRLNGRWFTDENVIDNRLEFPQSENSVLSQSRQAVVVMATIHLFLIAEKSGSGSDNGGCYDNNSSLSYHGNLTTEQRRQSMLSQHRCLAE